MPMYVTAARVALRLPESHSLKDKRQIVKSLLARARNTFQVSAAEIGEQDRWQIAELGFACVSASAAHSAEVIDGVERFIADTRPDLDRIEYQVETFDLGA